MTAHPIRHRTLAIVATLILALAPRPAAADILVSGQGSGDIERFNQVTGKYLGTFISADTKVNGGLQQPVGMRYGYDGNLYVSSMGTNQILEYNGQTGAFIKVFAQGGGLTSPSDLQFGRDGNLYVANLAGASISEFDGTTGAAVGSGVFASGGNLIAPDTLAFGADGGLYVGDLYSSVVVRYNLNDPTHPTVFASGGGLDGVGGIAFGADGNLYASSLTPDFPNNATPPKIVEFYGPTSNQGTPGSLIGDFVPNTGFASFPAGLLFLPYQGGLLAASAGLNQVLGFNALTGAASGFFTSGGSLNIAGQIVLTPVAGDANADGMVDGADYTVWADHFHKNTKLGPMGGDFNHDGYVDGADYTAWADHFHNAVGAGLPGPYVVPEPASLSLAAIALALLLWRAQRRGLSA